MLTIQSPTATFTLPSSWDEVTLVQYLRLYEAMRTNTDAGMSPIRTALESTTSGSSVLHRLEAAELAQVIGQMGFLADAPDFMSLPVPVSVADVTPPTRLGECPLIQKWLVDEIIEGRRQQSQPTDFVTLAPSLLGIYLYAGLKGQLIRDASQVTEVEAQILLLPCTQALPLAAFILANYQTSTSSGQTQYILHPPQGAGPRSSTVTAAELETGRGYLFWARAASHRLTDYASLRT